MEKNPFKEYLRESEPDKAHKGYAWSTAIGLQAVDGLKPSKYLIDTAIQNIEGKITMKEAQSLIDSYYEIKTRDVVKGTIKTLDKAAVAGERMKQAYARTKDKAEHGVYAAESAPEEYAADRVSGGVETAAYEAAHQLDKR